jgi:hypothetical protein
MKVIKLQFTKENVNFFSSLDFMKDHNSEGRDNLSLHQVITLWSTGLYHVYVPLDDDDMPMGMCHGRITHGDFFGHCYFLEGHRGHEGLCGMHECAKRIKKDFNAKRIIANILDFNRAAKIFVRSEGFVKDGNYYILDLKEY